jgi:hypothetical protein
VATTQRRQKLSRTTLGCGPWKSVFNTNDPYDASPEFLVDLKNAYIPDAEEGSGAYARAGFFLKNGGARLVVDGDPLIRSAGQGMYHHTMLDGSIINFVMVAGRLFRVSGADGGSAGTFTDVSPVGITIDRDQFGRVYFCSIVGMLIVTDGVNPPWIGTNLTNTPITGAYIDYDGAAVAWSAFGKPIVKDGALIFMLNQVGGVSRRVDISWSIAGDPTQGYQQPNFDYNWTLETNDADVLFAIEATEQAVIYWRQNSFSAAFGTVGADFRSTATRDSETFNVGCRTCSSVQKFGDSFFFCDSAGRPYRWTVGSAPQAIWKQMRAEVDEARTDQISVNDLMITSAIDATFNLYVVAIWSSDLSTTARPNRIFAFDAPTGAYMGVWSIYDFGAGAPTNNQGIQIDCLGTLWDQANVPRLVVIGAGPEQIPGPTDDGGYVWILSTTEEAAVSSACWLDAGALQPDRNAVTDRLGYSEDVVYNVDRATIVLGNSTPCTVSVTTPNAVNTVQGTPSPNTGGDDDTFRLVIGCDVMGRGPSVSVSPTTCTEQWVLQRIALTAVPSTAHPQDG